MLLLVQLVIASAAQAAMPKSSGGPTGARPVQHYPENFLFGETTDTNCQCSASFSGVGEVEVTSCDLFSSTSCGQEMSLPDGLGSSDFEGCECTCLEGYEQTAEAMPRSDEDGLFIRGVPDFWQFRYGCPFKNKVGCGPVAMAEILYWYGSRGFPELVDDHEMSEVNTPQNYELMLDVLAAQGDTEPEYWHAWQTLVRELRDDYVSGLCMSRAWNGKGLYATTEESFMEGLSLYAREQGVNLGIDVFKIDDNNADFGLNLIKKELRAGRPMVIRFNSDRSFESFFSDGGEDIFSGKISNGLWYNDHYAIITGYRKTNSGRDVLYLNMGGGLTLSGGITSTPETGTNTTADFPGTDLPVEWNPAGKWVRLYKVKVYDEPSDVSNCESTLTTARDPLYFPEGFVRADGLPADVGFSHVTKKSTYRALSSSKPHEIDDCGSVADYVEAWEPIWSHDELVCPNEAEPGTLGPEDFPSDTGDRLDPW